MPAAGEPRLILNCDDFGSALCANEAVAAALSAGIATSATVMIPCPWGYDAVQRAVAHPDWAVGVHLTHTAEWPTYRWRPLLPISRVPGLCGPDGFMWRRTEDVQAHATADEVRAESIAQIEQAIAWGLRPTHLDSHMGVLQTHGPFAEVYLDLARRFNLPVRMAGAREIAEALAWAPWAAELRERARAQGVRFADDLVMGSRRRADEDHRAFLLRTLAELQPGTSEMLFHPAADTPELRAMTGGGGADRVRDLRLLTEDAEVRRTIAERGIRLVSYRDLAGAR